MTAPCDCGLPDYQSLGAEGRRRGNGITFRFFTEFAQGVCGGGEDQVLAGTPGSVTCTARSLREFSPSLRLAAAEYLRGVLNRYRQRRENRGALEACRPRAPIIAGPRPTGGKGGPNDDTEAYHNREVCTCLSKR